MFLTALLIRHAVKGVKDGKQAFQDLSVNPAETRGKAEQRQASGEAGPVYRMIMKAEGAIRGDHGERDDWYGYDHPLDNSPVDDPLESSAVGQPASASKKGEMDGEYHAGASKGEDHAAPDAPPSYDSVVPETSVQHHEAPYPGNTTRSTRQGCEAFPAQHTTRPDQRQGGPGQDYTNHPGGSVYATTARCGKNHHHLARKAAKEERKALRREHKAERRALKAERRYERDMLRAGRTPDVEARCKSMSC